MPRKPVTSVKLTDEQFDAVMSADLSFEEATMLLQHATKAIATARAVDGMKILKVRTIIALHDKQSPADLLHALRDALDLRQPVKKEPA